MNTRAAVTAVLWCYIAACVSSVSQWSALFGGHGLLPVHDEWTATWAAFLSLDAATFMILGLSMCACVACMLTFVNSGTARAVGLLLLSAFYGNVLAAGTTFLSFQWDILLVEAGYAAAIASLCPSVGAVVLRLAIVKLMLQSGAVKLQAKCPTWKGLTATQVHFASQCIPTPAAWWVHNVPTPLNTLSVALTLFIEGPLVPLLLTPLPAAAALGAWVQIFLQVIIIVSGNYNFFNLLTIALALASLPGPQEAVSPLDVRCSTAGICAPVRTWRVVMRTRPALMLQWAGLTMTTAYSWAWMFNSRLNISEVRSGQLPWWHVLDVQLRRHVYSQEGLKSTLAHTLPVLVAIAGVQLLFAVLESVMDLCESSVQSSKGAMRTILSAVTFPVRLCWRLTVAGAAVVVFGASATNLLALEPSTLGPDAKLPIPSSIRVPLVEAYHYLQPWRVTSSYGLFRRMTGVGPTHKDDWGRTVVDTARPELILEAQFDGEEWHELELPYKPGHPSRVAPVIAPHQPRLDWQMWFAALGQGVGDSPWLLSLVRGLLEGVPSSYALMDVEVWPSQVRVEVPLDGSTASSASSVSSGQATATVRSVRLMRVPSAIRVTRWEYDFSAPSSPWIARQFVVPKDQAKPALPDPAPQAHHPITTAVLGMLPEGLQDQIRHARWASMARRSNVTWWRRRQLPGVYLPPLIARDPQLPGIFGQLGLPTSVEVPALKVQGNVQPVKATEDVVGVLKLGGSASSSLRNHLGAGHAAVNCTALLGDGSKREARQRLAQQAMLRSAFRVTAWKLYQDLLDRPKAAWAAVAEGWAAGTGAATKLLQSRAAWLACHAVNTGTRFGILPSPSYGSTVDVEQPDGPTVRLVHLAHTAHYNPLWLLVAVAAIPAFLQGVRAIATSCRVACCRGSTPRRGDDRAAAPAQVRGPRRSNGQALAASNAKLADKQKQKRA